MNGETALVPFEGARLITAEIDGVPHVATRPIAEHLGLDWSSQRHRIMRNAALRTCVVRMTTQVPGDDQSRRVMMLPIGMLSGWLFGVQVTSVRPELRDRLLAYQRESFAALDAYWRQGIAVNPRRRVIADLDDRVQDHALTMGERFAKERARWESRETRSLAGVLWLTEKRLKALETGQKPIKTAEMMHYLIGLGMDVRYIYFGDRSLTSAEREVLEIMRTAGPEVRRDMISHAETMPVLHSATGLLASTSILND